MLSLWILLVTIFTGYLAEMCVMIIRIYWAVRYEIYYVVGTPSVKNRHMLQISIIYCNATGCHIHALRVISGI